MGNCCGKASSDDHFAGAGRTLGSAPPTNNNARSSVPTSATGATPKASTPGRTLGAKTSNVLSADDPRSAAAAAAEARANKAGGSGPLAKQLQEQKKQTRTATLEQVSRENRQQRDADAVAEARNWN